METLATIKNVPFLGEHPSIQQRVLLTSGDGETALVAGSVIGTATVEDTTTTGLYGAAENMTVVGILAEDIVVPAEGDAWATVYVHCSVRTAGLVWGEDVSATEQGEAIEQMRDLGIYVEG